MESAEPAPAAVPAAADEGLAAAGPAASAGFGVPSRKRSERSSRDMALSLIVLLVPIALVLGFYRLVLDGDEPLTVDPRPAIAEAQSARAFPVAEPLGLGDDWHVSTATFRRVDGGATLRLGYVNPAGQPMQLVESSVPVTKLLDAELGPGVGPRGTFRAGTRIWQRYEARPGEDALVLLEKGRTVIVVGATADPHLQTLAASLS